MKIEQEVPDVFQPVVITLESMAEVNCFLEAVSARIFVLDGNEAFSDECDWLATIANFLEEVK